MSFLDTVRTVTITNLDDYDQGPSRIYWKNGERKARTGGRFYTKADQYNDELTIPWVASDLYPDEEGYEASMLRIAIIGFRQQAFRREDDRYVWLKEWETGAQLYTELLCFAEGVEAPVVWVAKGLTGRAVTGKGGILSTYRTGLLREAERQAGKKLPLWTFWLPVSTELDNHGRVAYIGTGYGSNSVTPPALHLPHDDLQACLEELFVGQELLTWGDEVRQEFDTWLKFKRGESHPETQTEQQESAHIQEIARTSTATSDPDDLPF